MVVEGGPGADALQAIEAGCSPCLCRCNPRALRIVRFPMQTPTQTQVTEAPVAEAPAPPKTIRTVGTDGKEITIAVPRSIEEMQELIARRDQLSDQLGSVSSRRSDIVAQLRSSPDGAARTGLEDRLKVLDARILQLERDLASTGQQLASAPSDLAEATEVASRPRSGGDDFEEGVAAGVFPTAGFFILVLAFRRWRRKRKGPKPAVKLNDESARRLERLEQGMEAIAIEIERVSEGQRFVTKLLSEAPVLNERQLVGVEKTANP